MTLLQPDTTLVVVHMQPDLFVYAGWVLKPVLALIETSLIANQGIVLSRFRDIEGLPPGPNHPALEERLAGYNRLARANGTQEDASGEVIAACEAACLSTNHLRVCGVTTDDCLTKTAHGLAGKLPDSRIEVVKAACLCWNIRYDWLQFSHLSNVIAV